MEECKVSEQFSESAESESPSPVKSSPSKGSQNDRDEAAGHAPAEQKLEVNFSCYGINLENTVKLLSCSKNISMVQKSDPKAKRQFISGFTTVREQKALGTKSEQTR